MRKSIWICGLVVGCATSGPVAAQDKPAPAPAAPITATGTLQLNITLVATASLPAGTVVSLDPNASVYDSVYNNSSYVFTSAKVSGGRVLVTLKIPYKWLVASTKDTVSVYLSASANGSNSTASLYDSTYLNKTFPLPANGATTVLNFIGAI